MTPAPIRFTVQLAGQALAEVEGLAAIAAERGLRPVLAEILRVMMVNLETQPREWGDPSITTQPWIWSVTSGPFCPPSYGSATRFTTPNPSSGFRPSVR